MSRLSQRFAVLAALLFAALSAPAFAQWYSSDGSTSTGDITSFADRVGSNLSQTVASAATPPGSTDSGGRGGSDFGGSSGGGSSGGGGGGGGGSGW
jgi:hypothetical protein